MVRNPNRNVTQVQDYSVKFVKVEPTQQLKDDIREWLTQHSFFVGVLIQILSDDDKDKAVNNLVNGCVGLFSSGFTCLSCPDLFRKDSNFIFDESRHFVPAPSFEVIP